MSDNRSKPRKSPRIRAKRPRRSIDVAQLEEFEEKEAILRGLRSGEIDAIVTESPSGRKTLRTLESDEHPYRMLVESMNEGAATLLQDGTLFYCNGFFSRMLGATSDQLVGRALEEFVSDDDKHTLRGLLVSARRGPIRGEVHLHGTGDALFSVYLSLAPVTLGQLTGLSLVATDLTDRLAGEEKLKALNESLERRVRERTIDLEQAIQARDASVRARDEFLSIASHELRTPLMSLKLQNEIARHIVRATDAGQAPPRTFNAWLEINARQINQLTRLVDDMLDVSRIELNKIALAPERVDLAELAVSVVEVLRPQLEAAGCEVSTQAPSPVIGAWDRFRIEQVITNLLTNVCKYAPRRPVAVTITQHASSATLIVQDHGMGIAKEHQSRIFGRFERAVSARQVSGFGIGLYISRHIVEAHHGRIWVESEPGQGAKFVVELPLDSSLTPSD